MASASIDRETMMRRVRLCGLLTPEQIQRAYDLAAETALGTVRDFVVEHQAPPLVRIVLFSGGSFGAFARVLESMVMS